MTCSCRVIIRCLCEGCKQKPALVMSNWYTGKTCLMTVLEFLEHANPGLQEEHNELEEEDIADRCLDSIIVIPPPGLQVLGGWGREGF